MIKNLLYYTAVILFGGWLIYTLYMAPELNSIKADIEAHNYRLTHLVD